MHAFLYYVAFHRQYKGYHQHAHHYWIPNMVVGDHWLKEKEAATNHGGGRT